MGESITTRLDIPYNQQPATRAKAVRVMQRLGATDLIEVLGLDDKPAAPPNPEDCGTCGNRLPAHGVCRRSQSCRDGVGGAGQRPKCPHCSRPVSLDGRCRRSSCYPGVLARKRAAS